MVTIKGQLQVMINVLSAELTRDLPNKIILRSIGQQLIELSNTIEYEKEN